MEGFLEVLKSDNFMLINFLLEVVFGIVSIVAVVLLCKLNNEYKSFMNKIGNGTNISEMLKVYLNDIDLVKKDNEEIKAYYTKLDSDIASCVQKVGLVRYNAFKDVGSDLSFALTLLDRDNNGVVLNGIYGSDSSNIYAKPIKNGESQYQLSDEEKYAIDLAEQTKNFIAKHKK